MTTDWSLNNDRLIAYDDKLIAYNDNEITFSLYLKLKERPSLTTDTIKNYLFTHLSI